MGFINLDERSICGLIAFLGIIYTPGEAGFCYCFFGVDLDTPLMDSYCLFDSILVFGASVFLLMGTYQEKSKFLLAYIILAVISLIAFYAILIYTLVTISIIMHFEFFLPANLWKAFQLYGLYYVIKHFREIRKKEKSS